ncbi:Methionine adenosyltransferase regulatory beta subunit-related [Phytophthora megakarya]|uniref:Methionine adenosyltransferase regulatory beta subunit-related n=1 Tax=Phytophthora megakarya TaxID=4795 RepID=A0A225VRB5_9STRA|nr:Methionine adenosyltransferase regulatory beta subunit-related [Phytophthora megakarya]
MARVLVLGGTSYVAQFVLQRLQDETIRVRTGDALEEVDAVACTIRSQVFSSLPAGFVTAGSEVKVSKSVQVYWQVDVVDLEALEKCIRDFHPTVVINCTAISSPAACEKNPEETRTVNEPRGLVSLLEKLPWCLRFVHLSTDFVYEGKQPWGNSYQEDDAVLSSELSVYGAGKLRFDQFLLEHSSPNLQMLILRIANVVGPAAPLFPDNSAPKFMQWLHHQLFQPETANTPLKLWSDEFRSYLYIVDLITVMFKLLEIRTTEHTTLVNVGGMEALSRIEIARKYLAACSRHNPNAVSTVTREIVPTLRAQVDLGYPSPLDTRLSTARIAELLPTFTWTPTSEILNKISRSFLG